MKCYVCNEKITNLNETDEHIIINAAGGRLKSKKLICKKCNSDFGEKIDSLLAKQLNSLSNLLMVKRHRGIPQPIIAEKESTGEKYLLEVGGKPMFTKPKIITKETDNKTTIQVVARTEKELKKILTGIAKKHSGLNVKEAMKVAKWNTEEFDTPLHFQIEIGGNEVFRAVCKCATNFYIYKNGDATHIKHLLKYIRGEEEKNIVWLHYQENIYKPNPNESSHIIHLVANQKEKILYCYIEYFNTYKYIVLLNDEYEGSDMTETYIFDLINIVPIEKSLNVNYDREVLLGFFTNKDSKPFDKVKKAFNHSVSLGLKRQESFQRSELIKKAIQNTLGKYPEGIPITEDMINETVNEIVKEVTPHLIRNLKKKH